MLPKISIVTPSFNQGQFLETTIKSVLEQDYPNLEYVIMDGNSTDGSIDIIRKYEQKLAFWVSAPDGGQYDAINQGFAKTTGEIMAWLNSDDKYMPWAFSLVAEIFSTFPQVEWITTANYIIWDKLGRAVNSGWQPGFSRYAFLRGMYLHGANWYSTGCIQQESTFWRRSVWDRSGGYIDASMKMAGDFDLWARFCRHTDLYTVYAPLAGFRQYGDQKTTHNMKVYLEEAESSLRRHGGHPYSRLESAIRHLFNRRRDKIFAPPAVISWLPLFHPVKLILWSLEGWQIVNGGII